MRQNLKNNLEVPLAASKYSYAKRWKKKASRSTRKKNPPAQKLVPADNEDRKRQIIA